MNKHPEYLLNKISGPKDLKKLSIPEMEELAKEIRTFSKKTQLKVVTLVQTWVS